MNLARFLPRSLFAALLCGMIALHVAFATGGLSPSLINPDEGGHYVNALFLGDWIRAGFPAPMAFAQDYYAHFPRLSIGHWPPGWYVLEAPVFALFRPSPLHATVLSAIVAGMPGFAVFWAFERLKRPWFGLALALAYVLLPLAVDAGRYILLDQPVALVVAIGAIAWLKAAEDPRWWRFLIFAAFAAFAPLVKGNGALIALVPAIDIALNGRWALLRKPWLWIAAVLTMAVVAPWYWLSFKISAGGFNYAPGIEYAWLALAANMAAVWSNLGPAGIGLALFGGWRAWNGTPEEARIAKLAVAVIAATLVFQSIVPASLEPRYISPLLPWLVVLIGLALVPLLRRDAQSGMALAGLSLVALMPALIALATLPPKPDSRAFNYGKAMVEVGGLWLVDGRAGDEGALIAAAAWADDGKRAIWVTRASQWLSTSDFMGRGYKLTAADPQAVREVLAKLGVKGVVSVAERNRYAYPHSRILYRALTPDDYALLRLPFARGEGTALRAIHLRPIEPNTALIRQNSGSANVSKMSESVR